MNTRKMAFENLESKNLLAADLVALDFDVVKETEVRDQEIVRKLGDFDRNTVVDARDIDMLGAAIRDSNSDPKFDLDGNRTVDRDDMDMLIHDILHTNYGDADLNGAVDGRDFLKMRENLFSAGSGWESGDFNTDRAVDLRDFLLWSQNQEFVKPGDFNQDGEVDAQDVDTLGAAIAHSSSEMRFDLDGNCTVDREDMDTLIHDILQTNYGDADLDGAVDGRDFLAMRDSLFSEGSGWSSGDFNTDGTVDLRDFLLWSQNQEFVKPGDFNRDGVIDVKDIDTLGAAIGGSSSDLGFDLDGNGTVDRGDMDTLIHDILHTNYGDADLNGVVDGRDFLAMRDSLFAEGSGWESGDFNSDGAVDGRDLLLWSQNEELESAPRNPGKPKRLIKHLLGRHDESRQQIDFARPL